MSRSIANAPPIANASWKCPRWSNGSRRRAGSGMRSRNPSPLSKGGRPAAADRAPLLTGLAPDERVGPWLARRLARPLLRRAGGHDDLGWRSTMSMRRRDFLKATASAAALAAPSIRSAAAQSRRDMLLTLSESGPNSLDIM